MVFIDMLQHARSSRCVSQSVIGISNQWIYFIVQNLMLQPAVADICMATSDPRSYRCVTFIDPIAMRVTRTNIISPLLVIFPVYSEASIVQVLATNCVRSGAYRRIC